MEKQFKLKSPYVPMGDQPEAIKTLVQNIKNGADKLTLLGATGTGKTFTIANVIQETQKPTLVLAHNKTLAGQLYAELKNFFPENHVEYFISYYDYFQPEAYIPGRDIYIEKDATINQEIEQMRHGATMSILEHKDTIIVASVSCIYGLGDPEQYKKSVIVLRKNQAITRAQLIESLINIQFSRNDLDFKRGTFRVKGDNVDILPMHEKNEGIRVVFDDDSIEKITIFEAVSGKLNAHCDIVTIYPATQFVTDKEKIEEALRRIDEEKEQQIEYFKEHELLLEAQRIKERTNYDIEFIREMGFCSGIENYSRHLLLKEAGATPTVLLDYFQDDFLVVVDESHVSLPQVRGMYLGDRSRKETLVKYGFRLPSALDNRPLTFPEFEKKTKQIIYVSATPGDYELENSKQIVEQIIRPTGLIDPEIIVRPTEGQIDHVIADIRERIAKNERTLITTLTIRMSEELTRYLKEVGIKVAYLHSEIKSLDRLDIIRKLRRGDYQCLVGINLLREGLDLPEVSLICILDADKEGFLRSERSLIQTIGRAARHKNGKVIMYADKMTDSMAKAISETNRRRHIQEAYNLKHGIVPESIVKEIGESINIIENLETTQTVDSAGFAMMTSLEKRNLIETLEKQMKEAAKNQNFEEAMLLRDTIIELKAGLK